MFSWSGSAVIGGRVTPSFTRNAMTRAGIETASAGFLVGSIDLRGLLVREPNPGDKRADIADPMTSADSREEPPVDQLQRLLRGLRPDLRQLPRDDQRRPRDPELTVRRPKTVLLLLVLLPLLVLNGVVILPVYWITLTLNRTLRPRAVEI